MPSALANLKVLDFSRADRAAGGDAAGRPRRSRHQVRASLERRYPPVGTALRPVRRGHVLSVGQPQQGSLVLDLANDAELGRARRLASETDVLVENFRPGVMARFGLGYEDLRVSNPGLIYCSITGFGRGKGAALPGYDLLIQALGGLMRRSRAGGQARVCDERCARRAPCGAAGSARAKTGRTPCRRLGERADRRGRPSRGRQRHSRRIRTRLRPWPVPRGHDRPRRRGDDRADPQSDRPLRDAAELPLRPSTVQQPSHPSGVSRRHTDGKMLIVDNLGHHRGGSLGRPERIDRWLRTP